MTDNATRLRALPGSFSSLDMEEVEASVPVQRPEEVDENSRIGNVSPSLSEGTTSLPDSTTKISMNQNGVTENERLRSEVADLQSQLLILRSHLQRERADRLHREEVQRKQLLQSQNKDKTRQGKGVVLEMPKSMSCLKSGTRDATQKDHQSLSTEDDQDTIEPSQDLEAHESAAGLKHRNHQPPSTPEPSSEMKKKKQTAKGQLSDDEDEEAGGLAPLLESCDKDGLLKMELEPMETGTTTPGADEQFWQSVSDRAGWLVGLLVLQSMSSFILARNEALLQQHLVIVRFLTMLVGAGGNAGNQASVRGKLTCATIFMWGVCLITCAFVHSSLFQLFVGLQWELLTTATRTLSFEENFSWV